MIGKLGERKGKATTGRGEWRRNERTEPENRRRNVK
jgi:hypothetical protein